jgi:hypothetical protein
MGLFDRGGSSGTPWEVDAITLEYLISGRVEGDALKWGWAYFEFPVTSSPARPLELVVTEARSLGNLAAPELTGRRTAVARATALVALAPRDAAAIALWDQWNTFPPVPADVLVGPYALSGSVLSIDGSATSPVLGGTFAMRDAVLRRVDGAGDGVAMELPRVSVESRFVHAMSTR